MSAKAKICGLSKPEAVNAALAGGAAMVGFVFFDASPRRVTVEIAARLAEPVRGRAKVAAVVVDPDDALLEQLSVTLKPDFIQLHGKETPERVLLVRQRTGAEVIKAIAVSDASDVDAASPFEGVADYLMFDAKPPKGAACRAASGPGSIGMCWRADGSHGPGSWPAALIHGM